VDSSQVGKRRAIVGEMMDQEKKDREFRPLRFFPY
jgi:hypothetical protein